MVHRFLRTDPLQNVDFSKVGNMQVFFRNCTHILIRTRGEKFEDMFLVKIASKGTSLKSSLKHDRKHNYMLQLYGDQVLQQLFAKAGM